MTDSLTDNFKSRDASASKKKERKNYYQYYYHQYFSVHILHYFGMTNILGGPAPECPC